MYVVLTAADHEKNGFVQLVRWPDTSEAEARAFIAEQDEKVCAESEPDIRSAPFTFILDLYEGFYDLVGNGERLLPMQVAMALAPDQVSAWLKARPEPDQVCRRAIPMLATAHPRLTPDLPATEGER